MDDSRFADEVTFALRAGDPARAEGIARERLIAVPDDGFTLSALGQVLLEAGVLEEAAACLGHPQALAARLESYSLLAQAQYSLTAFDSCEATLETRLALEPPMPVTDYILLAKLKGRKGTAQEHNDVLKGGLDRYPDNLDMVVHYIDSAFTLDPMHAFAEIDRYLQRLSYVPGAAPVMLRRRTMFRSSLREKELAVAGYPASWEEVWNWLDPEGLAQFERCAQEEAKGGKTNLPAFLDLGALALIRGQWDAAGQIFKLARKRRPGSYADGAGFGAAFHAELDAVTEEDLGRGLAPVQRLREADADGPGLFLASDSKYFLRFSLPFLRTLNEQAPGQIVQVHIMDGEESEWRDLLHAAHGLDNIRLGFSAEASGMRARPIHEARFHYHAVRFIRFYEELKRRGSPLWILDVDVQLLKDPREGLSALADFDIALAGRWHTLDPVMKMWACCVGVSPTAPGLAFMRRVAAYVHYWKNTGATVWGTDQLALLSTYAYHVEQGTAPRTWFLQPDFVGAMGESAGALRFMGGIRKYHD